MKKKLIALLCAISMLASSAVALADAENISQEPADGITETVGGDENDIVNDDDDAEADITEDDEEGEANVEEDADDDADADIDDADEDNDEADIDDETADEEDEDKATALPAGAVTLTMVGPMPANVESVDKTELTGLIAEASAITSEMVTAAILSQLTTAITAAQAVADDDDATEADVREVIDDLDEAVAKAVQAIRDDLYDILNECKGLDKGIIGAESYSAYDKAYKNATVGRWDPDKTGAELYNLGVAVKTTFAAASADMQATEKILSGNVVTDADKVLYPGMKSDTLPDLKLSWSNFKEIGSNNKPLLDAPGSEATACAQLLNGVGKTPYHNQPTICFGSWDWRGTAKIDMNMGEEAYVTGVDFWENTANEGGGGGSNICSDRIEVWTSNDGENWTLRKSVDVDQSDCPIMLKGTRVTLDEPVKCRHVRLAVVEEKGNQVRYNEVVLRGYRTVQESSTPVSFDEIDYRSNTGAKERIITLDGVSKVKVSGTVKNNTANEMKVWVITAAYKDGNLIDMIFADKELDGFGTKDFSNTITIGNDSDVKLHTFVWDGFTNTKALSEIETFGLDGHQMASVNKDGNGAEFSIADERLTVWGQTSGKSAFNNVTLMVLKAGVTTENISSLTKVKQKQAILYLEQTAPKADGSYAFEYFPNDTSKMYGNNNVYVRTQSGDQLFYRALFLDRAGENTILEAFRGADTAAEMRNVLNTYAYLVNGVAAIDEIVDKYDTDETPDTVATSPVFDSVAAMLPGVSFTDANNVVAQIFAAAALTDVNNVATTEEVIASIDKYADELGIGDNGIYTKLYSVDKNAEFKQEVSADFVNQGYANIKDFIAQFCEDVVVGLMNNITNYSDVMTILGADSDYLSSVGFNFSGYNKLKPSQQTRVQKAVSNKVSGRNSYADLEAIKKVFNDAVKNPGTDKNYGGSYSDSGSTGSASLGTSVPMSGVTAQDVSVFKDLSGVDWARESILALYKKGIVSGMTENQFAPDENVTREQFTKMLIAAFELLNDDAECDFDDADTEAWYYRYIASAVNEGIVFGVSDDNFGVGENITREDMAVLAYRALVAKGNKVVYDKSQISTFTDDAEISEYAREAVYAMRGNNIMLGRGNNEFRPQAFATRAEAAKIIYSIMAK